jgi:hypothetical protein
MKDMKLEAPIELPQLQRFILEQPHDINHWRRLYNKLSSVQDDRSAALSEAISRLSRAEIESRQPLPGSSEYANQPTQKTVNTNTSQLASREEQDFLLISEIEKAHQLADQGAFLESKKILVKIIKAETSHIRAWSQYWLAKCLYDQYQLISSLFICQNIIQEELAPCDLLDLAKDLHASIIDGINYQVEICSGHIKPSFYCKQLLRIRPNTIDLPESSIDCYKHYQYVGFRLGINPAPWFDTRTYLVNNPDISHSGCCPFFHYLAAGKKEGRIATEHGANYATYVNTQAGLPKDLYDESLFWLKPSQGDTHLNNFELSDLSETPYILSISHDSYYESPGGIQLCIQREQRCFQEKGLDYIHVFPRQPSPMPLHARNPQTELVVSKNGMRLGVTSLLSLSKAFSKKQPRALVIHSLLGISPQDVCDLICRPYNEQKIFYWMHDFSALCSSYQLLRNKVSFCGSPPLDSSQCKYCFYGNSRKGNIKSIMPLLMLAQTEFVFPSHAALNAWEEGKKALGHVLSNQYHVINHISLLKSESVNRDYTNRLPRIAFLGHPAYAKGWDVFASLIRDPAIFNNFEWYHLGATKDPLSSDIEYVNVSISQSPDAMIAAVRDIEIDFALIWPQWPETFCLTAYEAIIGGANIITNLESGNVAAFAQSIPYGHILPNESSALKDFLLELTPAKASTFSFPSNLEYKYSKMSAEVFA